MLSFRTVTAALCVAMTCPIAFPAWAAGGYVFMEKSGVVSIEAEHFTAGRSYTEVSGKSGRAMQLPACAVRGGSCPMGYVRYNIGFTKAGKYTIWLLCRSALDSHGNEFQGRIDTDTTFSDPYARGNGAPYPESSPQHLAMMPIDQKGVYFTRMRTGEDGDITFEWRSMAKSSRPVQGATPVTPMRFDVRTPGKHHIEFIPGNENGWAIDKIVLVLDGTRPSGTGPAETIGTTSVREDGSPISAINRPAARTQLSISRDSAREAFLGLDGRSLTRVLTRAIVVESRR